MKTFLRPGSEQRLAEEGRTEETRGPPTATREQMLGGWHSGPADSNYRAKQSAKRVSPHQSEEVDLWSDRCGMISALFYASGVWCDGGGVASTGRVVHTKPVCAD